MSPPDSPTIPKDVEKSSERQSVATRRNRQSTIRIAGGIPIPPHMKSPGDDGYRTPTGEDYEFHRRMSEFKPNHVHFHTPNYDQSPSSAKSYRSHSTVVGEYLEEELQWTERLRHFTWGFFGSTMATGGIASILYQVPFRFQGIDTIGTIFFLFNLVLFVINCICISIRFIYWPETFKASFLHPTESLFFPAALVSCGTVLTNISQYGLYNTGPWLNEAVLALFWFQAAAAVIASSGVYLLVWSTQTFTIKTMTPIWVFPAYPLLIVGPHAGLLSGLLDSSHALSIIIGGFTLQGIGFMVSIMVYSAFIYRLMTQKLPKESSRPGMFVSIGPSAFTCSALISMGASLERALPPDYMGDGPLVALILKVIANWMSLWLWGMALWFFFVSVGAHISCAGKGGLQFAMTWFSFVFPVTALIGATFSIGKAFDSLVIDLVGCVMTCLLIMVWFFVMIMMVRAIIRGRILWPDKQEDRDEGGFKGPENRRKSSAV